MPQIIDMNELVPEDIIVRAGKPPKDYPLPGDMDVETVFRLFEMFKALSVTEGDPDDIIAQVKGRFGDIQAELLRLFQVRNPTLERLPFGIRGIGEMLKVVLAQLGLTVTAEESPTPAPAPKRAATTKRATSVKSRPRSRRSPG